MKKLTDIEMFRYWIDSEVTLLHIMFAIVVWLLTHNPFVHILLALYIIFSAMYMFTRLAYIAQQDRDYLKVPK